MKLASAAFFVQQVSAVDVSRIKVDPSTGAYVDEDGRTRIFHGMNVVYKKSPWYPQLEGFSPTDSLDVETMANMQKWGFNVVRLGVMWPGVEPQAGQIGHDYLGTISGLMSRLAEHGVYTIADLHQDIGSRRFCGEGFPEHYVDTLLSDPESGVARAAAFPSPNPAKLTMNASGFPDLGDCLQRQFAEYYLTSQVGALWDEFYTPGTPLNVGFSRFWGAVASELKHAPHLLAYELINEPSGYCLGGNAASCLKAPGEIVTHAVERKLLTPLYRSAAKAIRAAGGTQPILYEPTVLPRVGTDIFDGPVLEEDDQQGLAYHIYCAPGDGEGAASDAFCKAAQALYSHTYKHFLDKHKGMAGFLTEFGAVAGNALELKHLNMLLASADEHLQGWAYWQLKKFQDITTANAAESLYDVEGKLEVEKLKTLSRTYAQAIGGTPQKMIFDPESAHFQLQFNATVLTAPTVIYLNEELHYPHGYVVDVHPQTCMFVSSNTTNYLHGWLSQSCQGSMVTIDISRAAAVSV